MPIYDRECEKCTARVLDCFESCGAEDPKCGLCGGYMKRVWLSSAPAAIDDSIPGGEFCENVSHRGETFYSKSEKRRFLKETGQMEFVRHVGLRGSDKNPNTTRWI